MRDTQTPPPPTGVDAVVVHFERRWQAGERPAIEDVLAGCPPADRPAALGELAHVELEFRLKAGEPARAEEYLARFPELAADPPSARGLVEAELRLRRRRGESPAPDELRARFPDLTGVTPPTGADGQYELPEQWQWVDFGTLVRTIRSGSTVPPGNDPTAFPILRSSSVRPGLIDLQDVRYLRPEQSENEDNYLSEGDLMFTRLSGSLEFVGNCTRVPALGGRRIQYPDRLFCAKLKEPAQASYLVYAFASPTIRDVLTAGAKSSAGHQRISINNLTNQPIPLPPIAEQQEIIRRVEALFRLADGIEAKVAVATARADRLTQAVLARAFRGELVPTEAELARQEGRDYEPAAALLERIRAERGQANARANGPRRRRTTPRQRRGLFDAEPGA
jgi:hypothetical protein